VVLVGSALLATQISGVIWHFSPFARLVQFPYRFFALWSFTGPWLIADITDSSHHANRWMLGLFAVVCLFVVALPYQKIQSIIRPEGYFTTNESTTTVANEYMPKWVNVNPTQRTPNRLEVFQGNAGIEERRVTTNTIDVIIRAKEESVLQINTIYYPGWGAVVDNKPVDISYDNPYGVMRITIPSGDHEVYMAFRETAGRFVADILSVASFILYIILYVIFNPSQRSSNTVKRNKSKI
jgi:hypothetical protein